MALSRDLLVSELSCRLSARRVVHSLAVARWAAALARIHGADPARADGAGLFHDAAKEWSPRRLMKYVRRHGVAVPGLKEILACGNANLLHGYVAAHWVNRRGLIRDRETRTAMARHTLGHPRMGLLDTILYVADFSSPDRRYPEAGRVRRLARRDLTAALRAVVSYKIQDVLRRSASLHPTTVALWNALGKNRS